MASFGGFISDIGVVVSFTSFKSRLLFPFLSCRRFCNFESRGGSGGHSLRAVRDTCLSEKVVRKYLVKLILTMSRGERIIRYSNIIRIIFEYQNIRIRIRSIFSNQIIFLFVFG